MYKTNTVPTRYVEPHNGTSTEPRGEPTSYVGLSKLYGKMNYAELTQGMKQNIQNNSQVHKRTQTGRNQTNL